VREAKHKVKVKGVGGTQLIVFKVVDLHCFFKVYASKNTKANILSFVEVEYMLMIRKNIGIGIIN
jgi:hypothetical protein